MKTIIASFAVLVALAGFVPVARGQGYVNFTSVSPTQFTNDYLNHAVWVALVDTHGSAGFSSSSNSMQGYSGGAAFDTDISLIGTNGTVNLNVLIQNGVGGSTGESVSSSINSLTPIYGLAIGIFSPDQQSGGTVTLNNWYLNSSYLSSVADTTSSSFGGAAGAFQDPSSIFNSLFSMHSGLGSGSYVYIVGYTVDPVPEPSTVALAGLGGAGLLIMLRRRK